MLPPYFQAVSIAVVAYALAGQLPQAADVTRAGFAFAYAVFAIANAFVIYRTQREMYEFTPVVRAITASVKDVDNKLLVATTSSLSDVCHEHKRELVMLY